MTDNSFECNCGRRLRPDPNQLEIRCRNCGSEFVYHVNVNYWDLSPDLSMRDFAQERVKNIFKTFEKILESYTNSSYQNIHTLDEPLYEKSDQRLDFMMNIHKQIIQYATTRLSELENERDRRL
jgi:phosphomevalonate kinase